MSGAALLNAGSRAISPLVPISTNVIESFSPVLCESWTWFWLNELTDAVIPRGEPPIATSTFAAASAALSSSCRLIATWGLPFVVPTPGCEGFPWGCNSKSVLLGVNVTPGLAKICSWLNRTLWASSPKAIAEAELVALVASASSLIWSCTLVVMSDIASPLELTSTSALVPATPSLAVSNSIT